MNWDDLNLRRLNCSAFIHMFIRFVRFSAPVRIQNNELNRWHRLNCPEAPKLIEKLVWHTKTPGSYQVVSMAPSFDNCCLKFRQQFRPHGPTKAVNYCVLHWKNSVLANHNSSQFMFSRPNISCTIKIINEICIKKHFLLRNSLGLLR